MGTRGETNSHKVWTPYAGVVFDLDRQTSAYASFTKVFNPQTAKDVSGNFLEPVTGKSYGAGVKREMFNGALNGSVAFFSAVQNNVARTDGANTTPDGAQAYVANGTGVRSRGLDMELAGAITSQWNVYAGYTFLTVDNRETEERADSRHVLRLQSTYRLSGALSRLTVGGGVSWQSHTVSVPYPGRPQQAAGRRVRCRTRDACQPWTLTALSRGQTPRPAPHFAHAAKTPWPRSRGKPRDPSHRPTPPGRASPAGTAKTVPPAPADPAALP